MLNPSRRRLAAFAFAWLALPALAQPPAAKESLPAPPKTTNAVAATVNGEAIPEAAVRRALKRVPADRQAKIRAEVLNFLIDNALIDQHLKRAKVEAAAAEVEKRLAEMKAEVKKQKLDFEQILKQMSLTEAELRRHVAADLRWEKYINAQATDKVLGELFNSNKELFDGTMVRARHILIAAEAGDAKKLAAAKADLATLKARVEKRAAEGVAKLPKDADNLTREKERRKLVEEAFAAAAKEKSACPSKQKGGDVGWFDRAGTMVESFSKAAFALKPFEISGVVQTQFGLHLILLLDRKPGKAIKFEDAKAEVKEVYQERLRESLVKQLRQKAKIEITPAGK